MRATVSFVTLVCFAPVATGCLSHEYAIPKSELGRLVEKPPETRGAQVRVVQQLGTRRGEAIEVQEPVAETPPPAQTETQNLAVGDGRLRGQRPGPGPASPAVRGGWRGSAGNGWSGAPAPSGGWHGAPASAGGGWHGAPASGGGGGGGWHGAPASGGGGLHLPSGGGGSSDGDALVVMAVVAVVLVAVAAVGLVGTEGMRFDGQVAMSPYQPVHLKRGDGEQVIALGDLTPAILAGVDEALVMDDEGYGFRRLGHELHRKGFAFKMDVGTLAFAGTDGDHTATVVGPTAHMQLGGFVTDTFGALLTAEVGGATDQFGATFTRHSFGLELQAFPLNAGIFHLGTYVNGGMAVAGKTGSDEVRSGPRLGGGLLAELESDRADGADVPRRGQRGLPWRMVVRRHRDNRASGVLSYCESAARQAQSWRCSAAASSPSPISTRSVRG